MNKFALLFVWGIVLILTSLRLYFYKPEVLPKNSLVRVEATVETLAVSESSQRFSLGDVVVFAPLFPELTVGDRVVVEGKVDAEGRMFEPTVEVIGHTKSVSSVLWKFRQNVARKVEALLPPREATLVVGTVLGVDNISRDFRQELTKTGTIHVVVVSGQNLAIVAGIFLALVRYIGRRTAMVLAVCACLFYALLTGFEAPVVRALLMVIVSTLALFFGRSATALLSLFAAALVIIFIWPSSILSVSFQLTFAATLGIVTLGAYLQKVFRIPIIGEVTAVCLGAFVFTAPVILYHFGQISLLSPLVNILVSEAIFPVMLLGFLVVVLSYIFMPAAQIVAYLVFVPAHYFVELVRFFAKFDVGVMQGFSGNTMLPILFVLFLVGMFFIWKGFGRVNR